MSDQVRATTADDNREDIWSVHVGTLPRTHSFSGMWSGSKLSRAPFQSTTTRHASQCPLLRCNSKTVSMHKVLFLSKAKPLFVNSPLQAESTVTQSTSCCSLEGTSKRSASDLLQSFASSSLEALSALAANFSMAAFVEATLASRFSCW